MKRVEENRESGIYCERVYEYERDRPRGVSNTSP